ncbi:MAG: SRPBCC domain-containing protein [Kutzneria sp.]|nr:SRPBCC domain-containing protein [Kutzneria sp.]MBV9844225.1 SRPBCC domain-containing protein [Kutzneria sp.]
MDEVFKALADVSRRRLLDSLNSHNGQSLRQLCGGLDMARQSVSKHLAVLIAANLVTTVWRGREKLHYLNAAPINAIADRWISKYDRDRVSALADLTTALERTPVSSTEFVYTTYINTTPQRLWQALTEPAFTRRYWGAELKSDWRVGSRVLWKEGSDEDYGDHGQVVLESDPYRRLSYSWHTFQPRHAECFGWTEEEFAQLREEKMSKVTFDIEPHGSTAVRLTVTHDDFGPDSMMHRAISGRLPGSGGWPELLANLKSLLETGATLRG